MVLSAGLAIAIKYVGPTLPIPASTTAALVGVWFPVLLMTVILGWRWQQQQDRNEE
jgi:xanthosine utilization system XapX-like protein